MNSCLQAMSKVEREKFVSAVMKPNAYKDIAIADWLWTDHFRSHTQLQYD